MDGEQNVEGSVKNLIAASAATLQSAIDDITDAGTGTIDTRIATHNTSGSAHATQFAAKQNKAIEATTTFAVSDFVANTDSTVPAAYMATKTIASLTAANDYVASLSVDPTAVAAALSAKFLPFNKINAGVLTIYANAIPSAQVVVNGTYIQIQ